MTLRMDKKTAVILIGLQASGKTTFYKERLAEYVHVNLDTLHTRNKERILLTDCLERGESFVVDNTNPQKADRERYIGEAKMRGYTVCGYYFESRVGVCLSRNESRNGKAKVPKAAVLATHKKLELPAYEEGFDELYYVRIVDDAFVVEPWKEESEE